MTKMFMRSKKSGKYIRNHVEEIRAGEEVDIWSLTDDPKEATNDPGFVAGQDYSMQMVMFLKEKYDEGTFECCGEEILVEEKETTDADN